ncbi:hypothetical protein G6M50_06435 [Agrobacterium rhizogenes]|jgi:hypothetical protein|nr:hypothetical protein [Rhizobium rhizogenes]NTJ77441.1 hypothetical protein [Rhizobium rhizogenes]
MKRKAVKWRSILRDYTIILSILIAAGALAVLAPAIGLPWIIGPLPLIATIWTAYGYMKGLIYKRMGDSARILCSFLLPIGVFSVLGELVFGEYNIRLLIVFSQILSGLSCYGLLLLANYVVSGSIFATDYKMVNRNVDDVDRGNVRIKAIKIIIMCNVIIVAFDYFVFNFDLNSKCTGKCRGYEVLIGQKTHVFANLYTSSLFGSLLIMGIIGGVSLFYRSLTARKLSS